MNDSERKNYARQWADKYPSMGPSIKFRKTGKTTAAILLAFARATESPGKWQPILDPDHIVAPHDWLLDTARHMANNLGFVYQWDRADGKTPMVKFKVADVRSQR